MSEVSTKVRLLQAGKAIFLEKGYNHTGLQEIVKSVGVPKGSFYHFFASKEDFGLAVLEHHLKAFQPIMDQHLLADKTVPPLQRLRNFFEAGCAQLESEECKGGCIVGNFAQEMADQNETFREYLSSALSHWQDQFTTCLKKAQEHGDISEDENVEALGQFLMNGWEGAILRMKVTKSMEPVHNFVAVIFDKVLAP
jgi:TetR/AcrR family transcriptional repressor of nem operon